MKTDADVADFLDIKASTLSMQKNRGKLDLARILDKCSDLNKHWLLHGEGPIWREEVEQEQVGGIPIYSSITTLENGKPDPGKSRKVSRVIADGEVPEYFKKYPQKNLVGYVVTVDAMNPTLREDDVTIVDTANRKPEDGKVFLVSFNRTVGCRRILKKPENCYSISCDNKVYESFDVSPDSDKLQIVGKVVWIIRRMQ